MKKYLLLFILMHLVSWSYAQDFAIDYSLDMIQQNFHRCMDENLPTTKASVDCIRSSYQAHDELLNKVYQGLMKSIPAASQGFLRESQRSWLAYRDAEFAFIDNLYHQIPGSISTIYAWTSKTDFVKNRILELDEYRQDWEDLYWEE